jgi:hypothetical protein
MPSAASRLGGAGFDGGEESMAAAVIFNYWFLCDFGFMICCLML